MNVEKYLKLSSNEKRLLYRGIMQKYNKISELPINKRDKDGMLEGYQNRLKDAIAILESLKG